MIADIIDLTSRKPRIREHRPRIHANQGQEDRNECATVLANEHDAISGAHARVTEPGACRTDYGMELVICPASRGLDQGQLIGRALCPWLDDVADTVGQRLQKLGGVDISHGRLSYQFALDRCGARMERCDLRKIASESADGKCFAASQHTETVTMQRR